MGILRNNCGSLSVAEIKGEYITFVGVLHFMQKIKKKIRLNKWTLLLYGGLLSDVPGNDGRPGRVTEKKESQ